MPRFVALLGDLWPILSTPVLIALITTLMVGCTLVLLRQRRPTRYPESLLFTATQPMPIPPPGVHERRRAERRHGQPKRVIIVDLGFKISSQRGYVMDRSLTGIRLALAHQLTNGSTIQIRPMNAPEDIQWVSAIVKNGRYIGDYYEVGCEFERTPSYRELISLG